MLDLDQCIANTSRAVLKEIHAKHGIGPGDEPYLGSNFNFEDEYPELSENSIRLIFERPSFWAGIKPFCGAYNFTRQLREFGTIIVATDRRWYPSIDKDTMHWLRNYNLAYNEIYFVKGTEKDEFCKAHKIDLAIEDNPKNIEEISKVCPVITIDWPYNRPKDLLEALRPKGHRVETYYQAVCAIYDLLPEINKSKITYPQSRIVICEQ